MLLREHGNEQIKPSSLGPAGVVIPRIFAKSEEAVEVLLERCHHQKTSVAELCLRRTASPTIVRP